MRLILAMPCETHAVGSTRNRAVHAAAALGIALAIALFGAPALGATPAPHAASAARAHRRLAKATPVPTPSGPVIYSVSASPTIAHAGDSVIWDAHVSQNVVSVTARVAVYSFSLYPVRYGHFGETFAIPKDVPPFFHGHYGVTITATTASGASTSRSIGLSFE